MKLLLVEDDMEISQMLKDYLRAENYEVVCAADGKEACEKFDSDSYALVLLDLMIPKISGHGSYAAYPAEQYGSDYHCVCKRYGCG